MNRKQKLFYAFAGFLLGNIIFVSMMYIVFYITDNQSSKNDISYSEALRRIKSSKIKAVNIEESRNANADSLGADNPHYLTTISEELHNEVVKESASSSQLERLFQILFILFIISPPIIVILLLIIISKMKSNDSIK